MRDNGPNPRSTTGTLVLRVLQGNMTSPAGLIDGEQDHLLVVAVLVGATVVIAVVVFLIVVRFVRRDRRERHPKYNGGLPMAVKTRTTNGPEEEVSSDEGPWRRYDELPRPNGNTVTGTSDVTYDNNDDVIMFKLKMASQYKELEPEDKVRLLIFSLNRIFYSGTGSTS